MWKILLVEDEPFVRRSIRQAIPWEDHGFAIAGEAAHGREALERMEALNPDIVISDIFMPYMDGIELLKAARSRGSEARFIMLTCAGEFEYARAALEYGATGYILKLSMEDAGLLGALGKAKAELEKLERQQELALSDRVGYLWRSMLGKELSGDEQEKLEELKRYDWGGDRPLIVTGLNGAQSFGYDRCCSLLGMSPGRGRLVHSHAQMGLTTLFIRWTGSALGSVKHTDRELPIICCTASASASASAGALEREWLENLRWLDRFYYERPTSDRAFESDYAFSAAVPWEMEQAIIRAFERHEPGECGDLLCGLWDYLAQQVLPMVLVKETAERLDKLFARISRKPPEDAAVLLNCTRHAVLLEELDRRMRRYAKGSRNRKPAETDHPEINAILDYLQQHYERDISLQAMAKYVSMDENYLSGLFKKKTGDTFINYLQKLRVDEAKFYLKETELTVAEIGERCGFANPSYFFKIFKRWTGLTPNEYRTA